MDRGVVLSVASLLGLSCGGGAASVFIPNVPGSAQFDELSDSQAKALCVGVQDYAKAQFAQPAFRDLVCRASALFQLSVSQDGVSDATVQSACEGQYMVCQSRLTNTSGSPLGGELPHDGTNSTVNLCSQPRGSSPDCTATVDQYAACLNENYALSPSAYPPCSAFTAATVEEFRSRPALGPACGAFARACPVYFVQSPVPVLF